jgi:hypothetical protein
MENERSPIGEEICPVWDVAEKFLKVGNFPSHGESVANMQTALGEGGRQ